MGMEIVITPFEDVRARTWASDVNNLLPDEPEFLETVASVAKAWNAVNLALTSAGMVDLEGGRWSDCDFSLSECPSEKPDHLSVCVHIEMFTGRILDSGVVFELSKLLLNHRIVIGLSMLPRYVDGGIEMLIESDRCLVGSRSKATAEYVAKMLTDLQKSAQC